MHGLDMFEEIDYRGWLVIEREQEKLSLEEASASVAFLRRLAH